MWQASPLVVAAVLASGAAGCFHDGDTPATSREIEQTRQFTNRATYWLGREFEGLRLYDTGVAEAGEVGFTYGTCTIPPDQHEGGCGPPLALQEFPTCRRSLWLYARYGRGGATTRAEGLENLARMRRGLVKVRGVPALTRGDRIEIYTGRSTIVVWGDRALRLRAAEALSGFNVAAADLRAGEPLPPPAPRTFTPRKPCFRNFPG